MNKKGVFISMTALLILGIIVAMMISRSEESSQKSDLNIQYSKHKYASDYVKDIENSYLPTIIAISEKQALIGISSYINQESTASLGPDLNLSYVIMSGHIDNDKSNPLTSVMDSRFTLLSLRNRTLSSLSVPINFSSFDFAVISVAQRDNWTITINSSVNFSLETKEVRWKNLRNYSTQLSINGLTHPVEGKIIKKKNWIANVSNPCYLNVLYDSYACKSISGICPLTGCTGIYP